MTKIELPNSEKNSYQSSREESKYQDNNDTAVKKKKRKKSRATICSAYCKFEIVRRTAKNLGMKEVPYVEPWNVLWTDYSVSIAKIKVLKGYQRVNHFPGMAEICHKALLAKNLNRMAKHFPKQYGFFPKTWCFPSEYNDAVEYSKRHVGKTYILKPGAGCRGQGIQLTKNFRSLPPVDKLICQIYISKPFLVDSLKFDLRVYTLISSCDPLKIFVYNEGLARFATAPYRKPAGYNLANCYMHLTNYSVNKYSSTFVSDGECGTKRRLSCLNQWLSRNLYDVDDIWAKIDDVIIKTIISALPVLKHSYQVSFPNHDVLPACFEILGFDILLDNNLNPYVLEVNHSPSFNTDSKVDEEIKLALLEDTFRLLNLSDMDTQKILDLDKRRAQMRLQNGLDPRDLNASFWAQDKSCAWEEGHRGNYRRVYPVTGKLAGSKDDPYKMFIDQSSSFNLLVTENASSKAREHVGKIQREQLSQKDQLEQLLKVHTVKQQPMPIKIPEISIKTENKNSSVKLPKSPVIENKMKAEIEENIPDNKLSSALKEKDDKNNISEVELKVDLKNEKEKLNNLTKSFQSSINFVILTDEDRTKNNSLAKVPIDTLGTDYFAKKLYKRLKESGHMPGTLYPSVEPKNIDNEVRAASVKIKKVDKEDNQKHKPVDGVKIIDLSNRVSVSKNEDRIHTKEIVRKEIPAKECTLRFQSRAATEFLKFQKMKLLKKLHDLT